MQSGDTAMQRRLLKAWSDRSMPRDLEAIGKSASDHVSCGEPSQFILVLFNIKPAALTKFPGIVAFCDYLEHDAFRPLMGPDFNSIWSLISRISPQHTTDCWHWSLAVLSALHSEQPEYSVQDLCRRLEHNSGQKLGKDQDKTFIYVAIFGVLCWSSLLVRPRLTFTGEVPPNLLCHPPLGFKSNSVSNNFKSSNRYTRPMLTTFRSFKQQFWTSQSDERRYFGTREYDSLFQGSLNIFVLQYFGKVTVQWVDTVSEHLLFNPANRRLSLFRFPTFCALLAVYGEDAASPIRRYCLYGRKHCKRLGKD